MGSRNGSNVRTMRTKFPPVSKGGEQQHKKALGLGLGVRSQGAHDFSAEGVDPVFGRIRTDGVVPGWVAQSLAAKPGQRRWLRAGKGEPATRAALPLAVLLCKSRESGGFSSRVSRRALQIGYEFTGKVLKPVEKNERRDRAVSSFRAFSQVFAGNAGQPLEWTPS